MEQDYVLMIHTNYCKYDEVRALGIHHMYKIYKEEPVNTSIIERERNCFIATSFSIVLGKGP